MDQRPSPRGATMHSFTVDGADVAHRKINADYGPFPARDGYPALAQLYDVTVEGGRRPMLFANLELTGVFCFTLYFLPPRYLQQ
jgi:hypothetical protein